jgi:DNA polymerase III gamma/tau subunit
MSFYHTYRPDEFSEVVGQEKAVAILQAKLEQDALPHVILLAGSTGIGKTTIARILANTLGCPAFGVAEINCAEVRGIDSVREIADAVKTYPLSGKRVFILDEIVQLPKTTQQAFLKVLEDTPDHTYFFLCASDVSGLLPTFLGRCFLLNLSPLNKEQLTEIIVNVARKEERELRGAVLNAIIAQCKGSARSALNLLEAAFTAKGQMEQLSAIGAATLEEEEIPIFLGKLLLSRAKWETVAAIIAKVEDKDIESLRRGLLGYACKALLEGWKGVDRRHAFLLIRMFEEPMFMSGRAGLAAAAWQFLADLR